MKSNSTWLLIQSLNRLPLREPNPPPTTPPHPYPPSLHRLPHCTQPPTPRRLVFIANADLQINEADIFLIRNTHSANHNFDLPSQQIIKFHSRPYTSFPLFQKYLFWVLLISVFAFSSKRKAYSLLEKQLGFWGLCLRRLIWLGFYVLCVSYCWGKRCLMLVSFNVV